MQHASKLMYIHTKLEKSENAALLVRLGPLSTLIHHENPAFHKHSLNWRNFKTLWCGQKTFRKGSFFETMISR